jgi:hypothetical protein
MGCHLEDYRARVGTWVGRLARSGVYRLGDANRERGHCLGLIALSAAILAVLLIIGGVEQNPGPTMENENTIKLSCTGCGRNLKTGIQCELCGHWYHYSCGNVKGDWTEREKWNCDKCKSERVKILQQDLQKALRLIDELKVRNKVLEEELIQARAGKRDRVSVKYKDAKCMVVGDSLVRNVGADQADIRVECFPGIKTEQLHNVMDLT